MNNRTNNERGDRLPTASSLIRDERARPARKARRGAGFAYRCEITGYRSGADSFPEREPGPSKFLGKGTRRSSPRNVSRNRSYARGAWSWFPGVRIYETDPAKRAGTMVVLWPELNGPTDDETLRGIREKAKVKRHFRST